MTRRARSAQVAEPAQPEPAPGDDAASGAPAPAADPAAPVTVAGPAGRPMGLRLARVHLRSGSLVLARAELEAFAGRGVLDEDALVDLAEVRWRTGDLPGAGEAANAAISRGREDALALVIAAEAVAAVGRPGEARRLAGRALKVVDGPLDPLFAGMPRSTVWPVDVPSDAGVSPEEPPGVPARARAGRHRAAGVGPGAAGAVLTASGAAVEAFAGGRGALAAGDPNTAAVRLGVAIRLDPGYAEGVLAAVGERPTNPALALVAGDALRLLGRESEAREAFDLARGRPEADRSATPVAGLFDDDEAS